MGALPTRASTSDPMLKRKLWLLFVWAAMECAAVNGMANGRFSTGSAEDPFSWLNSGAEAEQWALAQSLHTLEGLASDPRFTAYRETARKVILDDTRIAGTEGMFAVIHEGWLYNIWRTREHPLGVFKRIRPANLRDERPEWESLLVEGAPCRVSDGDQVLSLTPVWLGTRTMMMLTSAKGYAWREFDLSKRQFVDGGFELQPSTNSYVAWSDGDSLWVTTDFGSATVSADGFPLSIRLWSRGTPLSAATEVFRANENEDAQLSIGAVFDESGRRYIYAEVIKKNGSREYWALNRGKASLLALPTMPWGVFRGEYVFSLRADWTIHGRTWKAGSLLSMKAADAAGKAEIHLILPPPSERSTLESVHVTRTGLLVRGSENVRGRLWSLTRTRQGWQRTRLELPDFGTIQDTIFRTGPDDRPLVTHESFLDSVSLYAVDVKHTRTALLQSLRPQFHAELFEVDQLEATSADGTQVPYFVVRPKRFAFDGAAPTLLYGYGFGGASEYPWYQGVLGRLWLEPGGVYVLANVRGGGEFGSAWHVRQLDRRKTYEDFAAVALDLIRRKITSPRHLGVEGHSAGGLLAAVAITQHPELFNAAIVSAAPVDLLSPHKGRAEIGSELGFPDIPEHRAFLRATSPYENVRPHGPFPVPLVLSSRTDEIVPPGQPRRFTAKLKSMGRSVYYYETPNGGHGIASDPEGRATLEAVKYVYLTRQLRDSQTSLAASPH